MNIVLDTNVLFAAFASPAGTCAACVEAVLEQHTSVLSPHILGELYRHLTGKRGIEPVFVQQHVDFLAGSSTVVQPSAVDVGVVSDADDLPVLGTALAGQADYLVTGDRELLALGRIGKTVIVSPRVFLERLQAG